MSSLDFLTIRQYAFVVRLDIQHFRSSSLSTNILGISINPPSLKLQAFISAFTAAFFCIGAADAGFSPLLCPVQIADDTGDDGCNDDKDNDILHHGPNLLFRQIDKLSALRRTLPSPSDPYHGSAFPHRRPWPGQPPGLQQRGPLPERRDW